MVDVAMLVLFVGVAAISLQLGKWLISKWYGSSLPRVENVEVVGNCLKVSDGFYVGVYIDDCSCLASTDSTIVQRMLSLVASLPEVRGIYVFKRNMDKRSVLSQLENRILTLRVLLEREPGNPRIEGRLKVLESMYEKIASGVSPVSASLLLLIEGGSCEDALKFGERVRSEIATVTPCRPRLVKGASLLEALAGFACFRGKEVVTEDSLTTMISALTMTYSRTGVSEGVYIGRRRRDNSVFILPLWGREGARHTIILGPTGKGKTTLLAVIAVRASSLGWSVIGVDPKGDLATYLSRFFDVKRVSVSEALGAALWLYAEGYIAFKTLNEVFEAAGLHGVAEVFARHVDEGVEIDSIVDRSVVKRLARLGIGRLAPKPLELSDSLVLDLSWLPESLKNIVVAVAALQSLVGGKRVLVIDEAWRLGRLAQFHMVRLFKEARSKEVAVIAATQDPQDIPVEVFNNAFTIIAFGSSDDDYIDRVSRYIMLEPSERMLLKTLGVGEALVRVGLSPKAEIVVIDAEEVLGLEREGV